MALGTMEGWEGGERRGSSLARSTVVEEWSSRYFAFSKRDRRSVDEDLELLAA
jgi:hypothetical protein